MSSTPTAEKKTAITDESSVSADPNDLLSGIKVTTPDNTKEKTRKYICGIKTEPGSTDRFEFQVRVGPVTFATKTLRWEGEGEDAVLIPLKGSICDLTDKQVQEIRDKLRYRYIRWAKDSSGTILGVEDIDVSDGGAYDKDKNEWRAPRMIPGRLRGDEKPLYELLVFQRVHQVSGFEDKPITREQAMAVLAEVEAEEGRELENPDEYFEKGKKSSIKGLQQAAPRDVKALKNLSTTDGTKKAEAGFQG